MKIKTLYMIILIFLFSSISYSKTKGFYHLVMDTEDGLMVSSVVTPDDQKIRLDKKYPLVTLEINDSLVSSSAFQVLSVAKPITFKFKNKLEGQVIIEDEFSPGWKTILTIKNITDTTVKISNIIPLGQAKDHLFLTASGPWSLSRTKIFRPNLGPIGVILPDNAWEMGYSDVNTKNGFSICALSRRSDWKNAQRTRWHTLLEPGGSVVYEIYADGYSGVWQNGLNMMFRERFLYDLRDFDNSMFQRDDIKWIRQKYAIALQFGWDHSFYDPFHGGYKIEDFLDLGKRLFGGWEAFGLWPTWPTLGIDQRNQWDLYADLPGGLSQIRQLSQNMQKEGTKFFIAYNPWDQSTRQIDPYKGMAELIKNTDANGVILDTRGSSSHELQEAADGVKEGVVMYSEGMAVPKDMPGIVAGRVHDAIFLPPPLNLNKYIKPDFAIFRVCQLSQGRLHREFAISFFNGYGIEMNIFSPGRPDWIEEEYLYLGKLVKILRENSSAFISQEWTPLIPTHKDSIWVNRWPIENKTIYTIYSLIPEGFTGPLFKESFSSDTHFVSLYHHEEILADTVNNTLYLNAETDAFNRSWLGTRREGNVDCIAKFPKLLLVNLVDDSLQISANDGDRIAVWAGTPSYQGEAKSYSSIGKKSINLTNVFGRFEGKFVVQLFDKNELLDERIVNIKPGTPRLISKKNLSVKVSAPPKGMVKIPQGDFVFSIKKNEGFIPYPDFSLGKKVSVESFYIDKHPVTNFQYKEFIEATGYQPDDTINFLKHWNNQTYVDGQENFPVVFVSLEDVQTYATWAGKRLPTEIEWQYAAQGTDERLWPWGAEFDSSYCNVSLDKITPVNLFPEGKSPFGVMDLVGNIWQLTNDVYDNGSHYFVIIRGGSYYHPTSSWWYVKGGPQPLNESQILLRISQGFERNATVGFRCVMDSQ